MFPPNALQGILTLDLTRLLPGPMATQWMVDMGATVVKVEEPTQGDYMRSMNPAGYELVNRGKKSVTLDLKSDAGRAAFYNLVETADVLIEGFRPGVMDRLQCGYAALSARNPRLVYASLTGYGVDSAYRDLAGHDINYLSIAGVLDVIGTAAGPPVVPGIQIADLAGGSMQAVIGILAALMERHRTGKGQFVDVSMTHGSALMLPLALAQAQATGKSPKRGSEMLSGKYACYNVYRAKDGRYVSVGALEEKFWATLCKALACPEFIADQYAEDPRQTEITASLQRIFETANAEEWFAKLRHLDACVTPVRTTAEAAADLQLFPEPALPAPTLGEHNAEFLK